MDMFCPMCGEYHNVSVIEQENETPDKTRYLRRWLRCDKTGEEFVTAKMMDENLTRIREGESQHD